MDAPAAEEKHAAEDDSDEVIVSIPGPASREATSDSNDGEAEWQPTNGLAAQRLYGVCSIQNSFVRDGTRLCLIDKEATEEPVTNLPPAVHPNVVVSLGTKQEVAADHQQLQQFTAVGVHCAGSIVVGISKQEEKIAEIS
ncbi:hypothetical protein P3T76_015361 [Phytophthora citrophthora]|uniref:Uncharacterized protein n=1 Tax=Phytophthora citrophthora TaxID=4793 RepID=A0AAD9FZY4_9STRA|nr:hypothetical protein P3T76_015361 [Phytophthora citrophthora]